MSDHAGLADRPEFMKVLGLLPPYTTADVENAYADKLARLPTDGDTSDTLRAAYEEALDFARFRESRRGWMGNHIVQYSARQAVIDRISELGGSVVLQDVRRYLWSYGEDFAEIMRQLIHVELIGPEVLDSSLDVFSDEQTASEVLVLVLRNSGISDAGLARISHLRKLRCLDLRNTPISNESLETLSSFSHLEWLQLHGTQVGFWTRRRLRSRNRRLIIAAGELETPPPVYDAAWEHAQLTERIAALQ